MISHLVGGIASAPLPRRLPAPELRHDPPRPAPMPAATTADGAAHGLRRRALRADGTSVILRATRAGQISRIDGALGVTLDAQVAVLLRGGAGLLGPSVWLGRFGSCGGGMGVTSRVACHGSMTALRESYPQSRDGQAAAGSVRGFWSVICNRCIRTGNRCSVGGHQLCGGRTSAGPNEPGEWGQPPQQAPLRLWCQLPDFDQENVVSLTSVAIRVAFFPSSNDTQPVRHLPALSFALS